MPLQLLGLCQIAFTCSVFDFTVMNRQFYSMPNKRVLIEPTGSYFSHLFVFFNVFVSLWSLRRLCNHSSQGYQQFEQRTGIAEAFFSLLHHLCLIAVSGAGLYLCIKFTLTAQTVGVFTEHSEPKLFQDAANWYYVRLYALAVLCGSSTILNVISFCLQNNCSEFKGKETSLKM